MERKQFSEIIKDIQEKFDSQQSEYRHRFKNIIEAQSQIEPASAAHIQNNPTVPLVQALNAQGDVHVEPMDHEQIDEENKEPQHQNNGGHQNARPDVDQLQLLIQQRGGQVGHHRVIQGPSQVNY